MPEKKEPTQNDLPSSFTGLDGRTQKQTSHRSTKRGCLL